MTNPSSPSYIYERLKAHHGTPSWWPADSASEVMVGAVLTQNTAWSNVEKAIANFKGNLTPSNILALEPEKLTELIRPAGFQSRKGPTLIAVMEWFALYDFNENRIKRQDMHRLRTELLHIKGIGPETADSILLYAFDFPTFVVDAYTKRLVTRYPLNAGNSYESIKAFFEENLVSSALLYNEMHALIVLNGKSNCKKTPTCEGCALLDNCQRLI